MSELDTNSTLREFREYLVSTSTAKWSGTAISHFPNHGEHLRAQTFVVTDQRAERDEDPEIRSQESRRL